MGNSVFRSGGLLLSVNRDNAKLTESTASKIETIFDVLRANPKISIQRLEALLLQIPKHENILNAHDNLGYNLLQKSVGLNHIDLVKWILTKPHTDLNRFPCSLPLHIACLKGHEECVELLLRHGARLDTEARMCFPGPHSHNCEEMGKYKGDPDNVSVCERPNTKLQNCIGYAIDGDHVNVLNILSQKMEEPWVLFRGRKPLLHLACEKGAWRCVQHLVTTRSDEINLLKDEYYPIHQAVLHDRKFLELLIQYEAITTVRTSTQQMTLLHVVILTARKNAEDTLNTLKILLEHGCKELINAPDYLGTTPLNAVIVRYALEEARYGYDKWSKYEVLNLVRFLLQNGARQSINQAIGNSALACVFRHIRDWEVCYELVNMLLKEEPNADPNMVGRDGSTPLMVCLVPLINKDPLHSFTHSMKVFYLNCIRLLLQHGAETNCSYRSNLTPLHILIFSVSENFTVSVNCDIQKRANFDFIKNILILLLQHGLDTQKAVHPQHILQSIMDMVQNVRRCSDVLCIYELSLLILQYGGNINITLNNKTPGSIINEALSFDSGNQIRHLQVASCNDNGNEGLRNSFRNNGRNFILFYFIVLIMRKEFILTDPDKHYLKIINLFYATMRHDILYSCLKSLHNLFIVQVPTKSTEFLINYIESLYRKPRSLKELCRVTIYESLNYKLAQNINRLNMPIPIKDYVLNFE